MLKVCLQNRKELDFVKTDVPFNLIICLFVTISFSSTSESKISVSGYLPLVIRYLLLKHNEMQELIHLKH